MGAGTRLTVNGQGHDVGTPAGEPLLEVLRTELGLTGTKTGCAPGAGTCGACTVLLDGEPVRACDRTVGAVAGRAVTTVEGLAGDLGALSPLQQAFVDEQVVQCGWCTPAQLLVSTALLRAVPDPTPEQVGRGLDAVDCRCGTHPRAVRAVLRAAAAGRREPG
jgi:nicotinate dehydrogenase subunit A